MSSAKFMLTYARVIIFRRYEAHAPGAPLLKAFESMMVKHGVDLTLTGHEHAYERVHPNINGTVVSTLSSNGEYIAPKARTTKPLPHRHLVNLRTLLGGATVRSYLLYADTAVHNSGMTHHYVLNSGMTRMI